MTKQAAKPATLVEKYLGDIAEIQPHGTAETALYPVLTALLNAIGDDLQPKVVAISQLKDTGSGMPDYGLFTSEQMKRRKTIEDEKPARGVVEVKAPAADIKELISSAQTEKYLLGYGTVLATNYRQFALLQHDANSSPQIIAHYPLADNADEFWELCAHPKRAAAEHAERLYEFLRRAMEHDAPIESAADIARVLASYAREALFLLEHKQLGGNLRHDLEVALSMKFDDTEGQHFFHSTLAQTIFYGLFAAWLETAEGKKFDWRSASHSIKTPVMGGLFHAIMSPDFVHSGFAELLDGAAAALNRVTDKSKIWGDADAHNAIQYFYEPFLAQFDPVLRKEMGVWYTPPEIVRYMVERTDRVLREELNIPDGLAADNVCVLDPCGGTGAFVAEILRRIHKTCEKRGDGALAAKQVKDAAMQRIFSFEILPSSYIVAHWQIGALLKNIKAPLADGERAGIYLTNSLTNWEAGGEQGKLNLPGLGQERDAANKIKQAKPILVVIGNPPYNAFAGVSSEDEDNLVMPYKEGLVNRWGIKKFNLDDLYIRFFRMAENCVIKNDKGIICYISNYSYINEPSFVVMREKLLSAFNNIWVDSLNGDSRRTGKKTPDGKPDPSVFSTPMNKAGIRVGTAVGLFVRHRDDKKTAVVNFRDLWGTQKREDLESSLNKPKFNSQYKKAKPEEWNKFSFMPNMVGKGYLSWHTLPELLDSGDYDGLMEKRGGALFDADRNALEKRMRDYFNPQLSWEEYQKLGGGLAKNAAGFDAKEVRQSVLNTFNDEQIVPYITRPFDDRYCYYTNQSCVWNRHRPKLWLQYKHGNSFLISRGKNSIANEGAPMFFTHCLGDNGVLPLARYIPFYLHTEGDIIGHEKHANLSEQARRYLTELKFADPDKESQAAEIIWLHSLAVGYSPKYQHDNADGLKIDWPRIPLPQDRAVLQQSAALGARIKALLDTQNPVSDDVLITDLATLNGSGQNLLAADYWGYRDGKGKVYPGSGKIELSAWTKETLQNYTALGSPIRVYLNNDMYWENVPNAAWDYRIGGFQVAKKWLSYRSGKVLERPLTVSEARTFADMIRRLSALLLLADELDENYIAAQKETWTG